MASAKMNIKILTISEEELRKIIQEEVRKAVEPGAVRPPYYPPYVPPVPPVKPWWQNPVMCSGASISPNQEGYVIQ